jgi:hypothetical protein
MCSVAASTIETGSKADLAAFSLERLEGEICELAAHLNAAGARWLELVRALRGDPFGAPLAGTAAKAGRSGGAARARIGFRTAAG